MLYAENEEQPELKTFEFDAEKREVFIRFVFDVPPEKKFDYAADNVKKIQNWIVADCKPLVTVLLANISTDPKKPLSVIEKHLKAYVAKNTFDYFIHKNLHGFLSRELDFYIKNEVMHLDDVDTTDEKRVDTWLAKVRAIKRVGGVLIDFLSQIENFQKKLWLKKKFVISTNYCITLDRVSDKFYPEIIRNLAQWREWEKLGFLTTECDDQLSLEYTKKTVTRLVVKFPDTQYPFFISLANPDELLIMDNHGMKEWKPGTSRVVSKRITGKDFFAMHPYLMIDTKFFSEDFKERLLASLENIDEQCDGALIHAENFQALNVLQERYRKQIRCVYIDPPYNTGGDGFIYRDNYQHSSWLSMLKDRICLSKVLLNNYSLFFTSIDDNEESNARAILDAVFPHSFETQIIIQSNKRGQTYQRIAKTHEYLLTYATGDQSIINELGKNTTGSSVSSDHLGPYELWELRNRNPKFTKNNRPNLYYPIYIDPHSINEEGLALVSPTQTEKYSVEVCPLNNAGGFSCWRWGKNKLAENIIHDYDVVVGKQKRNGGWNIYEKARKDTTKAKSIWAETNVISEQGTIRLSQLGFSQFGFPKPTKLIEKALLLGTDNDSLVLDYFAGSGTTGEAVIDLNRIGSERRYILIEMGEYFYKVIIPRLQKVVFSRDWKDGKPVPELLTGEGKQIFDFVAEHSDGLFANTELENNTATNSSDNSFHGISHCFKYMALESYEDALSNIELSSDEKSTQMSLRFGDEYLIKYMLDLETKGSILNLKAFRDPFDYQLKVTEKNETKKVTVDVIETFNYLLGLTVVKMEARRIFRAAPDPNGEYEGAVKLALDNDGNYIFRQVEGTLPDGKRTLIIWRNVTDNLTESNAALDAYFTRYRINPADREYDVIYVNGDNNLENLKTDTENWKVRLIETEFKARMFEEA